MSWHKPGTDAVAANRDLAECQRVGQLNASRLAVPSPVPPAPVITATPSGSAVVSAPVPVSMPDSTLAQQHAIDCMRGRGYALRSTTH
jgi:hypothetical protein